MGFDVSWFGRWYLLLVALSIGSYLRIDDLRWQIFSDDEWHALLHAIRAKSYLELLRSFGEATAPPLTFAFRLLHDTIGLSEKILRLPMLVSGLLMLIAFPWVVPDRLGRRTRSIFAILLALSPILVYYSRYARTYSISLLLAFVGILAFFRWWSGGARRWSWLYAACAILCPYFHLAFLPTILAPFPFALAEAGYRRFRGGTLDEAGRSFRQLVVLGIVCGVGLGLALGVPLAHDWGSIARRAAKGHVEALTFLHSLPVLAGTGRWWLAWSMAVLAGAGAVLQAKRWPRFAGYLFWITLCSVLASSMSGAAAIHVPVVFLRYNLWAVPVFLLFIAIVLDRLLRPLRTEAGFAAALVAVAAALLALGPIPGIYGHVNSWTNHGIFQYAYDAANPFSYVPDRVPVRIPEFYRRLANEPEGSLVIAEAPWFYEWHNNLLPFYQKVHRQWVKAGYLGNFCQQPGARWRQPPRAKQLSFRNTVDISIPKAVGMHGIDYVVLHKDMKAEFPPRQGDQRLVPTNNLKPSRVHECVDGYRNILGEIVYQDQDIIVFDVRHLKTIDWT